MGTVVLVRHGRSTSNTAGTLAGRSEGVGLDDHGRAQADGLVGRLEGLPLAALISSPLQRCRETLAPLAADRSIEPIFDDRLTEVDYGEWTGKGLRELGKEPLWKVVQAHPSAAVFPGGEGLAGMASRAITAVREWDAKLAAEHGPQAVWLLCSHGDVIKSLLADALGIHLDGFQRIMVDPCSLSVISYTETRPFVVRMNDSGTALSALAPTKKRGRRRKASSDATVGGTTGTA